MEKGWIKLHRSIMDNPIWGGEPFSRGQAWIDLLMLANYKDNEFWLDGELIKIKRGEFITSYRKLSERWGWSSTKTRRFIFELEKARMVSAKSDAKKTTIKIWNYNKYQEVPEMDDDEKKRSEKRKKNAERNAKKTQKNLTKNNKEDKEEKEVPPAPVPPEPDEDDEEIVWEDAMVIWEREKKKEASE